MEGSFNQTYYTTDEDVIYTPDVPRKNKNPELANVAGGLKREDNLNHSDENCSHKEMKKPDIAVPENRVHKPSLFCVMTIGFIANTEYGVVMPTMNDYLTSIGGNPTMFGVAMSAFSFAQLCCLPLFGWWSDKRSMKEVFAVSLFVGIIGNFMFAGAQLVESPWLVVLGRFLAGVGAGNAALTNSFVSAVTTPQQRTVFMAQINGFNAIGLVSGPAFNIALAKLNITLYQSGSHYLKIDPYTGPGWFIAILLSVSLIFFLIFFREPHPPNMPTASFSDKKVNINSHDSYEHELDISSLSVFEKLKFYTKYLFLFTFTKPYGVCFLISFVQNFNFSVLETIITPITKTQYDWKPFQNSLMYSAISIQMIIVIIITAVQSKFMQDRWIILVGQMFVGVGLIYQLIFFEGSPHYEPISTPAPTPSLLMENATPHPTGQLVPGIKFYNFVIAIVILVMGIPSQNTSVMSLYSKLLNEEYGKSKQGLFMGIMLLFGSTARIVGPLWGGAGYDNLNHHILYGFLVGMWVFDVFMTLTFFSKLNPEAPKKGDIQATSGDDETQGLLYDPEKPSSRRTSITEQENDSETFSPPEEHSSMKDIFQDKVVLAADSLGSSRNLGGALARAIHENT